MRLKVSAILQDHTQHLIFNLHSHIAKPKKPTKEERIAEKKAKRRAEEKGPEQESSKPKTAEEVLAEKLKQQQLQEESDMALAIETFGVKHKLIDTMEPKSEEEFSEFQEALKAKITKFEVSVKVGGFDDHYHYNVTYLFGDPLPICYPTYLTADFAPLCKVHGKANHKHMQGL